MKEAFATDSARKLNALTDYNTHRAAVIPQSQMEEFIYLYESMPYNIELMNRPLEDYLQKKQKIRITGGIFRGKEGCIMRLHRNTRLVFAFGNMTVAVIICMLFRLRRLIRTLFCHPFNLHDTSRFLF